MSVKINIYKLSTGQHVVCFKDPTTEKRIRKKFSSSQAAKEHRHELELKYKSKGIGAFSSQPVAQLLEMHLEKCKWSSITERKNAFVSFCETFGHRKICDVGKPEVQEWMLSFQRQRKLSDRTMSRIKSNVGCFFTYLKDEGIIQSSPVDGIKFKRNPIQIKPRIVLSVDEVRQILENAKNFSPNVLYPYLYTIANIGARRSELICLLRKDVDFETGLIHLRQTKNGKDRAIVMSDKLTEIIKEHLASHNCENVFPCDLEREFGDHQMQRLIDKFKLYFPMEKDWGLHALRHSFAYNFLKGGGEMYQLQAILGHRHIETTVDLYGQLKAQDIKNVSPYEK